MAIAQGFTETEHIGLQTHCLVRAPGMQAKSGSYIVKNNHRAGAFAKAVYRRHKFRRGRLGYMVTTRLAQRAHQNRRNLLAVAVLEVVQRRYIVPRQAA